MREQMTVDERLESLARATERVHPSAGFSDRVMSALGEEWWTSLPRAAKRVVPVLALAAAVALVWAYQSTRDLDDAVTTTGNTVEIEW